MQPPAAAFTPQPQPAHAPAPPQSKSAVVGLINKLKPSPKPSAAAAPTTAKQSSSLTPALAGFLGGVAVMFLGGKLLGGSPEPAQLAPEPYAAATTAPEIVEETFLDATLEDATVSDAP